jgi:hypothetical protein
MGSYAYILKSKIKEILEVYRNKLGITFFINIQIK